MHPEFLEITVTFDYTDVSYTLYMHGNRYDIFRWATVQYGTMAILNIRSFDTKCDSDLGYSDSERVFLADTITLLPDGSYVNANDYYVTSDLARTLDHGYVPGLITTNWRVI